MDHTGTQHVLERIVMVALTIVSMLSIEELVQVGLVRKHKATGACDESRIGKIPRYYRGARCPSSNCRR